MPHGITGAAALVCNARECEAYVIVPIRFGTRRCLDEAVGRAERSGNPHASDYIDDFREVFKPHGWIIGGLGHYEEVGWVVVEQDMSAQCPDHPDYSSVPDSHLR